MHGRDFIGEDQMAFSPQLNPDRIGEIALEYARWLLQVCRVVVFLV